jgi:hypothetical protein
VLVAEDKILRKGFDSQGISRSVIDQINHTL